MRYRKENNIKRIVLSMMCASWGVMLNAAAPEGYYNSLNGLSGEGLKSAVTAVTMPEGFVSIVFGDGETSFKTWQAFHTSDVRTVEGKDVWWDMYSNNIVYVESGNKSLNIEHAVPNSWWGGKNGDEQAYQDLFNLNPSNSDANSKKSNNPMAYVSGNGSFFNGLSKVGSPASGYGGGAGTVFEPADEYKGDFARAYFYMLVAYPNIPWRTDKGGENMYTLSDKGPELKAWAKDMLLKWNAEDPVDSKEMIRNDAIYECQKNRNPFIDIPALAEYIWGEKSSQAFNVSGNQTRLIDRPASPAAKGMWLTAVDTYQGRNWEERLVEFDTNGNDLWISVDGGNYERYGNGISISRASKHGATHTLKAYCLANVGTYTLCSPVTTVTLVAKDKSATDYSLARYAEVKTGDEISSEKKYIIVDNLNLHVMGIDGSSFLPDCWFGRMKDGDFVEIPQGSALVEFVPSSQSGYYNLRLSDINGTVRGYWNASGKNKMKIDSTPTSATVKILDGNNVEISFTQNGSLQYNQTQPRFLNYSSAQGGLKLFAFNEFLEESAGVEEIGEEQDMGQVTIEGNNIFAPSGWRIFNLQGMELSGEDLQTGIYIVLNTRGASQKIMIK